MSFYGELFDTLNRAGVRYVVVGGLAVVLHGYARLTMDVDLLIDLEPPQARKAVDALVALGLTPRLPVDAHDFADPEIRGGWVRDKNMRVFSMIDPADPRRVVDLFAETPLPFDGVWERSVTIHAEGVAIRVVGVEDLIAMKETAGRARDRSDVEALRRIRDQDDSGTVSEWPVTYEANELAQRADASGLTPEQRLVWLEEAVGLASSVPRKTTRP